MFENSVLTHLSTCVVAQGKCLKKTPAIVLAIALCTFPSFAWPQWKPQSAVQIVVPNSAGGGNDEVARLMQRILASRKLLDVPSTVENKPGGGSDVALAYMTQKPGDGNVLNIVSVTQQLNHIAGLSKFNYTDFTTLSTLIGDYIGYAVRADSPLKSGKDLIERLKKDPSALSCGVTAIGGNNHIALVLAMRSAGVKDVAKLKTPVFRSSGDSLSALLGGHIDVHVGSIGPLKQHIESGRVRLLAISSDTRLTGVFAQTPTWKEQGVSGTFSTWRGVWGPKGMRPEQVAFWDQTLLKLSQTEDWKQELARNDWVNDYRSSKDTAAYLEALNIQLKNALKDIGLAKDLP